MPNHLSNISSINGMDILAKFFKPNYYYLSGLARVVLLG